MIQGTYNGIPNYNMVLTGSSNWASLGTAQDELFFTVRGRSVAKKYLQNFNLQWNNPRFTRNAYTTTYTEFRQARTVRTADGGLRTAYVTVRRPTTTVEPDGAVAAGPFWEGD